MPSAPLLLIAFLLSAILPLASPASTAEVEAHVEFSSPYNVAAVHGSSHSATGTLAVGGFALFLSFTLPLHDFRAFVSQHLVDVDASLLCLTPLLQPSSDHAAQPGGCYPLQPTDSQPSFPANDVCWGVGEHARCSARVEIPCHVLWPGNTTPRYITYAMNASVVLGGLWAHTRQPYYLAFFDGLAELDSDGAAPPDAADIGISSSSPAAPPHVALDRSSRAHLQLLDAVFLSWPTCPCPASRPFSQAALWIPGLRSCLPEHRDGNTVSVLWIVDGSEALVPGVGLPSAAVSGGSVYAMNCDAEATVPSHSAASVTHVGDTLHLSHEWSWRFLPWCLSLSSHPIFSPSSSYNPVYAVDRRALNLSSSTPPAQLMLLTRSRGDASAGAMNLILNITASSHRVIRLDIGCRGWAVLLAAASPHAAPHWHPAHATLQFAARLPVSHESRDNPSSWECAAELRQLGVAAALQHLLPLQAHLKRFYSTVAWDRLSASHISVTLLAAPYFRTPPPPLTSSAPLKCSMGSIDVCDVCDDGQSADECLSPQLLHYLTTVACVCARLSPPCPGIIKMKGSDTEHRLLLSNNPALYRLVLWSRLQLSVLQGSPIARYNAVVTSHQTGAGLGNLWHSTMSALLLAVVENAPLFVSFDVHPDSKKGRWDGMFSQAVDMAHSRRRVSAATRLWSSGVERVIVGPGADADNFLACDWGLNADDRSNAAVGGTVFSLQGGSFPLLALANDAHSQEIELLFGHNMDFYMSHFLVSAAPALRNAAEAFMKGMREHGAFVIGIHMRWVTNHAAEQYLIPEDLHQFMHSAATLASGRASVGIYIASDSAVHAARLATALLQRNQTWHIKSAPVGSYTSDGSTLDALFDALVLGLCDDFIATAGSTFSHFAAALGAHLPVVIGGSVFSHGRNRSNTYRVLPGNYVWGVGFTGDSTKVMQLPWYSSRYSNATWILEMPLPSCNDQAVDTGAAALSSYPHHPPLASANSTRRERVQARLLDLVTDRYELYERYSRESLCENQRFCV